MIKTYGSFASPSDIPSGTYNAIFNDVGTYGLPPDTCGADLDDATGLTFSQVQSDCAADVVEYHILYDTFFVSEDQPASGFIAMPAGLAGTLTADVSGQIQDPGTLTMIELAAGCCSFST